MDVAYVRDRLSDFLRAAVNEVTGEFIAQHDVAPPTTPVVVHYTSLPALFSMLHGSAEPNLEQTPAVPPADSDASTTPRGHRATGTDRRYLRLYDCANLNDPLEGAYFLKELVAPHDTLNVLEYVVQAPVYIGSFVTHRQNTQNKARDNLIFWRHYGREGRGSSIAIPVDRFSPSQCAATLHKVVYSQDAAAANALLLRPVLQCLYPIVRAAHKDRRQAVQRQVAATLLECLGAIPYLYKSHAYSYEEECRIVATASDLESHGGVRYDFEARPGDSGRLRMYGQHWCLRLTNILATDSVITLGPSVPRVDYVQYAIEQLLKSIGIRNLAVKQSRISYRQT